MKKESKTQLKFIALWAFLIISFSLLALFVLYEANGYRFNRNNWHFESAGLISLDGQPKQVDSIMLNNKKVATTLPIKTKRLLPGYYEVSVSKAGYNNWSKVIRVGGGQAYEEKKIVLFLTSPVIKESTNKITADSIKNGAQGQSAQIKIINNEIWYKEQLITRFSDIPKSAILTDDKFHIIFQVGTELRAIEFDGTNNTKLFDLPSTDAYIFSQNNDTIVYIDKDKIYEAKIR